MLETLQKVLPNGMPVREGMVGSAVIVQWWTNDAGDWVIIGRGIDGDICVLSQGTNDGPGAVKPSGLPL